MPANPFRTIGGFPRGLVEDMMKVGSCPGSPVALIAFVRYDGRGRIASASIPPAPAIGDCNQIFEALVRALFQDDPSLTVPEQLALVLLPDVLACLASTDASFTASNRPEQDKPSNIQPPKKIKDVRPVYPKSALDAREEGIVVLESEIATTGCVRAQRLVGSVTPALNGQAMFAVSQWRFTPALLNGSPVPVRLTVSVQFILR
jgi:TonB family protein